MLIQSTLISGRLEFRKLTGGDETGGRKEMPRKCRAGVQEIPRNNIIRRV